MEFSRYTNKKQVFLHRFKSYIYFHFNWSVSCLCNAFFFLAWRSYFVKVNFCFKNSSSESETGSNFSISVGFYAFLRWDYSVYMSSGGTLGLVLLPQMLGHSWCTKCCPAPAFPSSSPVWGMAPGHGRSYWGKYCSMLWCQYLRYLSLGTSAHLKGFGATASKSLGFCSFLSPCNRTSVPCVDSLTGKYSHCRCSDEDGSCVCRSLLI